MPSSGPARTAEGRSRVMIITGTRKGIGRYLVDYYRAAGWTVAGCARGPMDEVLEGYDHHELDVADERAVQSMVFEVAKRHGGIDALVNNAGIASMNHLLLTPKSTIDRILDTNVVGSFLFMREVAKVMVRKKRGRIVNFATVARPLNLEGESIYAASKAAVESLTQIAARELASYHVTVNAVGPTPVATDLIKNVPQDKMSALIARQAIQRLGTYEDITNVIDFFLREESAFITGQTVFLGGIS